MSTTVTRTTTAIAALMLGVSAFALGATAADAATRTEVKRMVIEEARNSIVPPALALAVAKIESDFQDRVLSHKGARGVMQIMPATARGEFGVDADELWDPRLNVQLGIDFLERLHAQYGGRWELALSHYNGGTLKGGVRS
jgi:soluble lytic murein transglycosylase-like protein